MAVKKFNRLSTLTQTIQNKSYRISIMSTPAIRSLFPWLTQKSLSYFLKQARGSCKIKRKKRRQKANQKQNFKKRLSSKITYFKTTTIKTLLKL